MWVSPKKKETKPQKIGCIITIPKLKLNETDVEQNDFVEGEQLTTDRTLNANNFENLTELVSRLNHNLQTDPLEGWSYADYKNLLSFNIYPLFF